MKKENPANPMNPEGIEEGDTVRLLSDSTVHRVTSVTGRFANKIFCPTIGHELYASCFQLVKKGEAKQADAR